MKVNGRIVAFAALETNLSNGAEGREKELLAKVGTPLALGGQEDWGLFLNDHGWEYQAL
jgi:hypothetical protein